MERQSTFAKGGDYRAVCGPERESLLLYLIVSMCCTKHTDFSTGVNQVVLARDAVSDEKKVTIISDTLVAIGGRGRRFPDIEQGGFFFAFGSIFAKSGMVPAECCHSKKLLRELKNFQVSASGRVSALDFPAQRGGRQ